jgi:hypothetical protein
MLPKRATKEHPVFLIASLATLKPPGVCGREKKVEENPRRKLDEVIAAIP